MLDRAGAISIDSKEVSRFRSRMTVPATSLNCRSDSLYRSNEAEKKYNGMDSAGRHAGCSRRLGYDAARDVYVATTDRQVTDQFLGELNPYSTKGKQFQNGVNQIVFSDGVVWDRFRMALQVAERVLQNAKTVGDDAIYGFINDNTLDGGAGDDFLTGLQGDDTYIFERGYGHDVIEDNGEVLFGRSSVPVGWARGVVRDHVRGAMNDNLAKVGCHAALRFGDERAVA